MLIYFWFTSVDFKKVKWHQSRRLRVVAVLIGLSLSATLVLSLYYTGVFHDAPDLPDRMEGEATFTTENGDQETYYIQVDYSRKIVQLTLVNPVSSTEGSHQFGRHVLSVNGNRTGNVTVNATKIVIQDYNKVRFLK